MRMLIVATAAAFAALCGAVSAAPVELHAQQLDSVTAGGVKSESWDIRSVTRTQNGKTVEEKTIRKRVWDGKRHIDRRVVVIDGKPRGDLALWKEYRQNQQKAIKATQKAIKRIKLDLSEFNFDFKF